MDTKHDCSGPDALGHLVLVRNDWSEAFAKGTARVHAHCGHTRAHAVMPTHREADARAHLEPHTHTRAQ